ncbi:Alpha-latrotoxin-Lt1a [Symbiodinium microadriaticum]|uniref:Alpha-latrotoxin-Lt1a n=1 Tax=Symbiodinium microadriaticum TaxID=2951 RepID=A0A1Q9C8A6_SYMMI|nr:Alpha-latrotoxin-Lt1a [Symbiodinium microadriaticum]CAE7246569.1 unnamed protein product [Symbiodinium sp. KB8]
MGSSLCLSGEDLTCSAHSTVHECRFPLWAVKVSDFLMMTGPPESHGALKEKDLLHEWYPGMFVIFVSHQWLSSVHPDPSGHQVQVLQQALRGIIDGTMQVHESLIARSDDKNLSAKTRECIADGFIFFDWFAIPQITARKHGVNEETTKSDAALAVQSIPAYVELSNLFIALVPELTHKDSSEPVNYSSWLSRGWCRAELWCRLLSNKFDTSVVVVYTPTEAEFMFPLDWQHNSIVEGNFTVEADRAEVVRLGQIVVESKIRHLQQFGPLSHYRFYLALRPKLLQQERLARDPESFLRHFRYDSLEAAARDRSGMNAVMCATLSGDTAVLRLLAEHRASMNHSLKDMSDLGYYDTQTPLMAAAKSQQDASVLATLIQLRADVNARARTGLVAMSFCRTPEQVKVMVEHRADMPPSSLSGIASFGGPETMKVLLSCRCDINQTEENRYGPLHATTLFSRGNCRAVETAKFLLAQHADVNARTVLSGSLALWCRAARAKLAVVGFENCNVLTRLGACMGGISPLGYAAMVGHEQLAQLYLDNGADLLPNDRGDTPEDLARYNQHYHLLPLLATFST